MLTKYAYIFIASSVFCTHTCRAAFDLLPAGARQNARGQTFFFSENDPFGPLSNPASLGQLSSVAFGTHYTRLFGLKDLSQTTGSVVLPAGIGGTGLIFGSFGNALYRETTVHSGWGAQVYENLFLGFLVTIGRLSIKNYGSTIRLWPNAGLLYTFSKKLIFGMSVVNFTQVRIGKAEDPLPQLTRMGIECRPKPGLKWTLEIYKDVRYPFELRSGLEISPFPFLSLQFGFTDRPQRVTFGTGIQINKLKIDYAIVSHPVLGVTQHASLILILKPVAAVSLFSS